MKKLSIPAAALFVLLSACGEQERETTPEQIAARETAFRQACAAQELSRTADEDLATIQTGLLALSPDDPASAVGRAATEAAMEYSTAYQTHAMLQLSVYALLDSAVNNAATTADSARYIERAGSFTVRNPDAGTLEANVVNAYQTDFLEVLQNPDHRCNWDTPFAAEEAAR